MCSTTALTPTSNITTNKKKKEPLVNWSEQEVEEWFLSTKYKDFAYKFKRLNGKELSQLTKEDFLQGCPEMGDTIYNAIQELKGKHLSKINKIIK